MYDEPIQQSMREWLESFQWTHFVTISTDKVLSEVNAQKSINKALKAAKVEQFVWARELTTKGFSHFHAVIVHSGNEKALKRHLKGVGGTLIGEFDPKRRSFEYLSKEFDKREHLWDFRL